jgi:hypothetical protein
LFSSSFVENIQNNSSDQLIDFGEDYDYVYRKASKKVKRNNSSKSDHKLKNSLAVSTESSRLIRLMPELMSSKSSQNTFFEEEEAPLMNS